MERQRLRQPGEALTQRPIDAHDQDRIDAVGLQRLLQLDLRHGQLRHFAEQLAQPLQHSGLQEPRLDCDLLCRRGCGRGSRASAALLPTKRCQRFSAPGQNQNLRLGACERLVERPQSRWPLEWRKALVLHTRHDGRIAPHRPVSPQGPIEREGPPATLSARNLLSPTGREPVQVSVCSRVVTLSNVAEKSRKRGEHHKEIEWQMSRRQIQVVNPTSLRSEHLRKFFAALPDDEVVPDQTGAVNDSVEVPAPCDNLGHATRDVLRRGDIECLVLHFDSGIFCGEVRQELTGRVRERRTSCQNQGPAADMTRDLLRKDAAQCAGTAGDQVCAALLPRG